MIPCYCGDLAEGERVLGPLRQFGPPLMDAVQPMPFPTMQKLLDDAFPDGTYNYWKSTFVTALSDEVIDLIVEHANRMRSPLSAVVIEFYAGAASRVGTSDTAFAQRQAEYDVGFMAQWTESRRGRHPCKVGARHGGRTQFLFERPLSVEFRQPRKALTRSAPPSARTILVWPS